MYPLRRTLLALWRARGKPAPAPGTHVETDLICWPWDCDMFGEMNNGRHLTLYDIGRFDCGARTGLFRVLRENRWTVVVGGASIRYRRRLRPFDRFTLRTALIGADAKWIYFQQSMVRNGHAHSSALVRTAVRRPGGTVPTDEVARVMGQSVPPDLPAWATAWIEADRARPWPPDPDLESSAAGTRGA